MRLEYSKTKLSEDNFVKLIAAISDSVEKFDFDSNDQPEDVWLESPSGGIITHNLEVLPKQVTVYEADDNQGTGMSPATFTAVTTSTITITVSKAFCRVLLNV